MARTLSQELRDRVITAIDGGLSCRAAADRFGVSASSAIRGEFAAAGVEAVIPAKKNRRMPIPHDCAKYRWRNLIERLFSKLKNWRRVATRYDKTKESYLGFVALASINSGYPLSTTPRPPLSRLAGTERALISRLSFLVPTGRPPRWFAAHKTTARFPCGSRVRSGSRTRALAITPNSVKYMRMNLPRHTLDAAHNGKTRPLDAADMAIYVYDAAVGHYTPPLDR